MNFKNEKIETVYNGYYFTTEIKTPKTFSYFMSIAEDLDILEIGENIEYFIIIGRELNDALNLTGDDKFDEKLMLAVVGTRAELVKDLKTLDMYRVMRKGCWFSDLIDSKLRTVSAGNNKSE